MQIDILKKDVIRSTLLSGVTNVHKPYLIGSSYTSVSFFWKQGYFLGIIVANGHGPTKEVTEQNEQDKFSGCQIS